MIINNSVSVQHDKTLGFSRIELYDNIIIIGNNTIKSQQDKSFFFVFEANVPTLNVLTYVSSKKDGLFTADAFL